MPGSITSCVSSSLVRSASHSMVPLTPLVSQVKSCRNGISATEPRLAHRSDAGDLMVNFTIIHAREARDALFANGDDAQGASALFLKSNNRYAKEEVTQFAKVYHQLKQQKLSPEDNQQLDTLAAKYVEKMVNDGLGERSGFGPWTQKTNKCYQQRNKLEHSLAKLASDVCGNEYSRLADSLLPEVTQFIFSSIETELGRPLEEGSFKTVMDLIDNSAKQAWESLRSYRSELLQERGAGVGKLSRDLDTVAILPELLRKLLPAIAEQLKQDGSQPDPGTNPRPSDEPAQPSVDDATQPQPPRSAAGSHHPGITINVGGIHINRDDHSVKYDDHSAKYDNHSQHNHYSNLADAGYVRSASATATADARGGLSHDASDEMGNKTSALKDVMTQARVVDLRPEVATLKPTHRLKPESAIPEPTHRLKPESAIPESIYRLQPDVIAGSTDSNKDNLHDAARQVARALTGLIETAKPSAVATSASRPTEITSTTTKSTLSDLAAPSAQRSLHGKLGDELSIGPASQQPAVVLKDGASASVTVGSKIKDTVPHELVKELEGVPTNARSDWSGLRFERVLPSRLIGTTLRDQASAQRELVRGLRMFMQPGAGVPLAMRRAFEALRDNVLPSDPLLCAERLKLLETDGSTADHQQLGELSNFMKDEHFGFKSQRANAAQFASRLIRNTDLLKGESHAMINQLLEGLGITSSKDKDLKKTSVAPQNSRVVLSELGALTRDLLTRPLETNKGRR